MADWHQRFLDLAAHIAGWSKDPSTRVGCVIVDGDRRIRSTGFNGFPRGIADDGRLEDRELKYKLVVHAEENALLQAARVGVSVKGCDLYVTFPPCSRCAVSIIQAGITAVWFPGVEIPERWRTDVGHGLDLLDEAQVGTLEHPRGLVVFVQLGPEWGHRRRLAAESGGTR